MASRGNVKQVYMGSAAVEFTYGGPKPPKALDVDVVGVTNRGNFHLTEGKGQNVEHALEQFAAVGEQLRATHGGHVERQTIVVSAPEKLNGGYYVNEGILHHGGEAVRVNGQTVNVVGAEQ